MQELIMIAILALAALVLDIVSPTKPHIPPKDAPEPTEDTDVGDTDAP